MKKFSLVGINLWLVVCLVLVQLAWLAPPQAAHAQTYEFIGTPNANFVHTDGASADVYRTAGNWFTEFNYRVSFGGTVTGTNAPGGPSISFTKRCGASPVFGDFSNSCRLIRFFWERPDGSLVEQGSTPVNTSAEVDGGLLPFGEFVAFVAVTQPDDDRVYLSGFTTAGFATPTPPPTSVFATPFPVENACIDGSLVNALPTSTPRVYITPTPFGTRPPATSTPAGTPTITPTPQPQSINAIANFDNTLAPWTSNGVSPFVSWSNVGGPNGAAGIAYLPFSDAPTVNVPGALSPPNITPQGPLLVYERLGMPRQIRVVAEVQVPNLPSGTYAYVQVFYWPDGGLGTTPWVLAQNIRINTAWHTVSALINVPSNSALPRAVALRAVIGIAPIDNPLGFQPQPLSSGVQMDNVRLVAGNDANNPTVTGLPVCNGSGGSTGPNPITQRICIIGRIDIDVFKCPRPESILEIGGWISWLVCNVSTFFTFSTENFEQLEAIRSRNARYQPFAAGSDLLEGIATVNTIIDYLSAIPSQNPNAGTFDFDRVYTDDALDRFPVLTTPSQNNFGWDMAMENCPATLLDISRTMAPGMCWAVSTLRPSFAVQFIQWLFDIACYAWLVRGFWRALRSQ